VQALNDAPELKKIVTFIKISRYRNWKWWFGRFCTSNL